MAQYLEIGGYTIPLYDFWNIVSTAVMFFYLVAQTKKFCNISPWSSKQSPPDQSIQAGIRQILAIIAVAFVLFRLLNPAFARWFTAGNANYYGSLTAWFIGITTMCVIFNRSPLLVHDLFAPALPIQLFFAKFACFFYGCCSGPEMPGSWYFSQRSERYEFPVQLVEALVALGLYVFLRWYQKRNKIPGILFPLYLTLYAASRFLTEYLRADFPNILGSLDAYQIMSVVYVFLGAALLLLVWLRHHRDASKAA